MTTDPSCIFCKIIRREIPADELLRDADIVAFRDLHPVAPTHILVIPTVHVAHLRAFAAQAEPSVAARLLSAAAELGGRFGPRGYRVVTNEGSDGGQTVNHLHLHVLAGRAMSWPPG
jgi:histidine triad (HIT) family protein